MDELQKGLALNDAQLKNPKPFGDDHFEELPAHLRDIRASDLSDSSRFFVSIFNELSV